MIDNPVTRDLCLAKTVAQIIGDAHQVILNAPRTKDAADDEAMRLLEAAYARLEGVR